MAGLYAIGSGLFDRNTGLIAALFYGVFQHWGTWKNLFGRRDVNESPYHLGVGNRVPPQLLTTATRTPGGGALLAGAFLLKQPAAIAAVPLGIYLLLPSYRVSRNLRRTNAIVHATMLTTGFFTVVGLVRLFFGSKASSTRRIWTVGDHDVPHVFWRRES